jgi:hypothetical protein
MQSDESSTIEAANMQTHSQYANVSFRTCINQTLLNELRFQQIGKQLVTSTAEVMAAPSWCNSKLAKLQTSAAIRLRSPRSEQSSSRIAFACVAGEAFGPLKHLIHHERHTFISHALARGRTLAGTFLAADFDENGIVNAADLTKWKTDSSTTGTATHMQGDGDGADFLV